MNIWRNTRTRDRGEGVSTTMSHEATAWAVKQRGRGLSPTDKLVLWHLSDYHNPTRGCFPSQEELSWSTEVPRRTLNRALATLEKKGLVRRFQQRGVDGQQEVTRYMLEFEENKRRTNRVPKWHAAERLEQGTSSDCGEAVENPGKTTVQPCGQNGDDFESRVPKPAKTVCQNGTGNLVKEPKGRVRVTRAYARSGAGDGENMPVWPGPEDVRQAVVAVHGETFARSYLDPCQLSVDGKTIMAKTLVARDRLRGLARHLIKVFGPYSITGPEGRK